MTAYSENFIAREVNCSKCRCQASRQGFRRPGTDFRQRLSPWASPGLSSRGRRLMDVLDLLTNGHLPQIQESPDVETQRRYLETLTLADLLAFRQQP